jgi:hypothetical protein
LTVNFAILGALPVHLGCGRFMARDSLGVNMYRYASPFPVVPGKSDADVRAVAEYFRANPGEYLDSRRAAGVALERAYLQKTPMGSFVVAYVESEGDPASTFAAVADTSRPLNRRFAEHVKEVHGVDITQPPAGPPPEILASWRDDRVAGYRKGFAFTAPLRPGATEAGTAFMNQAVAARLSEFEASRRSWDQNAEVVTLHHTPMGDVVAVYVEGVDPVEGNRRFAASNAPFDRWFKDELKKLFPPDIDFDQPVPAVEEVFDSQELLSA